MFLTKLTNEGEMSHAGSLEDKHMCMPSHLDYLVAVRSSKKELTSPCHGCGFNCSIGVFLLIFRDGDLGAPGCVASQFRGVHNSCP